MSAELDIDEDDDTEAPPANDPLGRSDELEQFLSRRTKRAASIVSAFAPMVQPLIDSYATTGEASEVLAVLTGIAEDYRAGEKWLERLRHEAALEIPKSLAGTHLA